MELFHIIVPIFTVGLIILATYLNNLKLRKKKHFQMNNYISTNNIFKFKRTFDLEIKKRNKKFSRETNLAARRRMQQSGNVSGSNDFNMMNNYFHYLVGYLFGDKEIWFTKWDLDLMEEEYPENLKKKLKQLNENEAKKKNSNISNERTKSLNVIDTFINPGPLENVYKGYSNQQKETVKQIIRETKEFFAGHEYSSCDKFLYCMLNQQMDIDCLDNSGRTPLFIACYLGKKTIVKKLLMKKANLYKKNAKFMYLCPLTTLIMKRRFFILRELIDEKKVDLMFLVNELEILHRQGSILTKEYEDAKKLLKPYLVKKQIINFIHQTKKIKYLKYFTDEQITHFIKKYVLSDVFKE